MKKDGVQILQKASLGMEKLHQKIVGVNIESIEYYLASSVYSIKCIKFTLEAHRALPDVLALERILLHPSLTGCLDKLHIQLPSMQMKKWLAQKTLYTNAALLTRSLGKPSITPRQAKKLVTYWKHTVANQVIEFDNIPFSLGERRTLHCQHKTHYYKPKPHTSDRVCKGQEKRDV